MKNINTRFIISNIVSSVIIIISIPLWNNQNKSLFHEKDLMQGIFLLSFFTLGFFLRIKKSREIARTMPKKELNTIEFRFLTLLFICGLFPAIPFVFGGVSNIFGGMNESGTTGMIISCSLFSCTVFVLFYENYMVSGAANPKPAKQTKWLDPVYNLYVGITITLVYDNWVIGPNSKLAWGMESFWSEFIASIFLVIMFMIPIQRLFWHEVFINSLGWKDNLKVSASCLLVLASAITPLFFL